MRGRFRVLVLVLALAVAGGLLAGCGGPTQAGAAAIVGTESVPLAAVQRGVDEVLAQPGIRESLSAAGYSPAVVARIKVSRQVQHLLLTEAARRDGIVVTDQQVDAELAKPQVHEQVTYGELAFDPAEARDAVRDQLIAEALATKYLDHLVVTADAVQVSSRDEALALARRMAAGPTQAAQALAAQGQNVQSYRAARPGQLPEQAVTAVFGTPAGQVVVTQARTGWAVLRVTERSTDAAPPAGANASSVSQFSERAVDLIGRRLTQPLAQELGVRVNPRYGTWDPVQLVVLPPGQQPSVVLPAQPAQQPQQS